MARRFEYRVIQLRESLIGGKLSDDKLAKSRTPRLPTVAATGPCPRS